MTTVLIVTKDVERGCRLADAAGGFAVNVCLIDSCARAESYARRLRVSLVVLDGDLARTALSDLAERLTPFAAVALVPGRNVVTLPGAAILDDLVEAGGLQTALQRLLVPSSRVSVFSVSDYVQLACMSRRSVELVCSNQHALGYIALAEGEVWDALAQDISGQRSLQNEAAFRYWVTRSEVAITLRPYTAATERSVFVGWEHLLLESMQFMDEGTTESLESWCAPVDNERSGALRAASGSELPESPNAPTIPPPSSQTYPRHARALVNRAIRAIMSRDYRVAEEAFAGALELVPDDKLVAHRLRKVRDYLHSERPDPSDAQS